nr:hypothetical protein [Tanacetum cinerariifolium]
MAPEYKNEELTINLTQVFSVHNLTLKPNQPEQPPFTDHMKDICYLVVYVDSKAPKPSSKTEKAPQGKKVGAIIGLKSKRSSKHTSESKTKASKSQTGQSKIETQSSSAKDKSPSHPLPPTLVVGEMHKEAQQAAGGPTSLWVTSKEGAHPQLSSGHDVSADFTAEADPGPSAPNDSIPLQQVAFSDLPHLASSVQEQLKTLDSLLGILKTITNTLNRFATLVENTSGATTTGVPSADKATALPAGGKKDVDTNLKNELVDLLGIDIVTQYYNKKLLYERYREKMKKRR